MKISVIIPLFNKKDSIRRAIDSVLNQTYKPLEIIIVNDGSTDGSAEIAREIQSEIIKVYDQSNQGVSVARNTGIRIAGGAWIAFLDADDEWLPGYLETLTNLALKYPECPVLATSYFLSGENGSMRELVLKRLPFNGSDGILMNYFTIAVLSEPPLWTSGVAVKKDVIMQTAFPAGITSGEDLITWARLAISNKIAYCTTPLSVFHQASAHTYNEKPNRLPQTPDYVGMELLKLYRLNKFTPGLRKYLSHWYKMRASIFLRLGMRKQAGIEGIRSIRLNLLNYKVYTYFILMILPNPLIRKVFITLGR
jgi:glycosyltransferase involved in cell wall biosynthesis